MVVAREVYGVWSTEGYNLYHLHRKTILRELGVDLEKEPVDPDVHNHRVKRNVLCGRNREEALQDYRLDGDDRRISNQLTIQGHQNEDQHQQ